jgi:hypothetical protein
VATPTASHWAGSTDIEFGHTVYIGLSAIIINIAVSVILTLIFKAARIPEGTDETLPQEYQADPGEAPAAAPAGVGVGSIGSAGDLPRISSGAVCRFPIYRQEGWLGKDQAAEDIHRLNAHEIVFAPRD